VTARLETALGIERALDHRQQCSPFSPGIHRIALKVSAETEIGEQPGRVLVKMQKRSGSIVEDAELFLLLPGPLLDLPNEDPTTVARLPYRRASLRAYITLQEFRALLEMQLGRRQSPTRSDYSYLN
jgi:hypothetical protein